jgi:diaminopimelate decarboxylase
VNNYWIEKHPFFFLNKWENIAAHITDYKSPSYIYSKDVIRYQYENLVRILPYNFSVFYAQKSNPNPEILRFIHKLGAGCDTASEGEMNFAFMSGFPEKKIMMTGPAKTESEIRSAVDNNLLSINAESLQEIILIDKICSELGKKQNILIRINPTFESGEKNRIIGGTGVSKFGIDIEQIPDILNIALKLNNISIKGIHIFNSSQILDSRRILRNIKNVFDIAIKVSADFGFDMEIIDAGGGFGIPYSHKEKFPDLEKLGNEINDLCENKKYKSFLMGVNVILEPGRFLTGLSGIYVTKVLYTKKSRSKKIALTDGGIHHLIRPVLIGQKHPILNLTAIAEGRKKKEEYLVAGPLCTSLDEFDDSALLNTVIPGDVLAVLNAGAYGFTESMPFFLSHKIANQIFIN